MAWIVAIASAGAACSTSQEQLTTKVDKALSITPAQLLAATGGATRRSHSVSPATGS
ncbi:MAG TPA: hypothetical protein VMS92_20505 [Mycobacterium sp.]|nr:hypothetical protein [Mycobacterium sp.]